MDLNYLKTLIDAGLPLWVITGGGLVCLVIDFCWPQKGGRSVFVAGVLVLASALYLAFRQWATGAVVAHDLLVTDRVTLFFVFLVIFVGLMSLFNSYSYLKAHENVSGEYVTLTLFSIVGMIFLFASDHLIVNFIGLETMSLAIYVLVGSNKEDIRSNEAAIKYYVMGSVASAILLYGIALLYASFGTFRLHDLSQVQLFSGLEYLPRIAVVLIVAGFLFKLALVPFHFWVPDVYEGAPTPVTGFMATGVKAAAFALFIRLLTALNYLPEGAVDKLLVICVVATLIVGNLGAIVQDNVKRMLAYSSIAHAGYLLLGLAVGYKNGKFDPEVASAVLFYLIGYSFMTLGAFAVLSVMVEEKKEATQFSDLHGLGTKRPGLALAFTLFMISLLGIPPTVGFAAKYAVFSNAVKNGYIGLAILGVITSLISAYYYLRPLEMMYFRGVPEKFRSFAEAPIHFTLMFSLVFCALAVVYLGLRPDDYLKLAHLAAQAFK